MIIGVLKEIKAEENRVCMTPAGVEVMKQNGHAVLVKKMPVGAADLITRHLRMPARRSSMAPKKFLNALIWSCMSNLFFPLCFLCG